MNLFFELLQVSIGTRPQLSLTPSDQDWDRAFALCKKHSLLGIAFCGIGKLPSSQFPYRQLKIRWAVNAERIKDENYRMNKICEKVYSHFLSNGFWNCVLKGQSNLYNYPSWLGIYRSPGDIDLLVESHNSSIASTINYVKSLLSNNCGSDKAEVRYHHVELNYFFETNVEVHFRPSYAYSPIRNYRIQEWFRNNQKELSTDFFTQASPSDIQVHFVVNTASFNVIYQLSHLYRHLFDEGIGLRQILDYYFVLLKYNELDQGSLSFDVNGSYQKLKKNLEKFGMLSFSSALMWVMQRVFAMPEKYLICLPDPHSGEFLLEEILRSGNFGQFDSSLAKADSGLLKHAFSKTRRNIRFLRYYPEEVICEPFFRLYHACWRFFKIWQFE